MLNLDVPIRTVAGVDLAADDEDELSFFVLPPPPRIAVGEGGPELHLLRLVDNGALSGGHLRFGVELSHPAARLEEARSTLAESLRDDRVALRPIPVVSAEAELLFVGRETTAEGGLTGLMRRGYGRTAAGFNPPHRANFSVALTADGVRVIEAALRSAGAPIGIIYRVRVEGLWPALRVLARVDWRRSYDHFSTHAREGALLTVEDFQTLFERLVESRAIDVQVVQGLTAEDAAAAPDPGPALQFIQREVVERFCEPVMQLSREPAQASLGTVGELFGVGSAFAVKALTQIEHAIGAYDFQHPTVITRTFTQQAHLADLLGGGPPDAHIADASVDHPFFRRFALRVRTARPLAESHLKEVVLNFAYGTNQEAKQLTAAQPEAIFDSWADASADGSWTILPDVTFADDAPLDAGGRARLAPLSGRGRELTLDLDRLLGLERIEVRASTDPRVLMTQAQLSHRRGAEARAERTIGLASAAPAQVAWFRDYEPTDRIDLAATHLLSTGRMIVAPPLRVDTRIVRLPPPFPGAMTIQLISDDDWTGLERVAVAVQKQADANSGTFTFDKPGQTAAVQLDLPDPADRSFRYRVARTWSSGVIEEDDWVQTDVPVVVVGRVSATRLVVDLTPLGVELPMAGIALVEVELSYIDAANHIRDVRTVVIRAVADTFRWEVPIKDPARRSYEYRVTLHLLGTGERKVGPWTPASERILVIPIVAV